MARLRKGRSNYDIVLKHGTASPIGLMLRNATGSGHPVDILVQYLPETSDVDAFKEWYWQNGESGSGWSRETPLSYQGGGSDYGEFVWLRKDGAAMPAGKLTELSLPPQVAALTTGRVFDAFEWGSAQDLYILTGSRYLIGMTAGVGTPFVAKDFGSGVATGNAALFDGVGGGRAYVSCGSTAPIQEFNGSTWSAGASGTERSRLATVNWVLGNALATGGSAGEGGNEGYRLIGTDSSGSGFYHVAGDPKVSANWSSLQKVGDANFSIQNIVSDGHVVWFGKPNGVHGVNGLGYSPNISKWFELASNPNNCGSIVYWEGAIWSTHQQGLVMIPVSGERQDIAQFVQFGYDKSNSSPIWGRPRWLAPTPEGLYVAYYNAALDTSYIGTIRMVGSVAKWSMAECVVPGEVTWMRQTSPAGIPRLMIGTLDSGGLMHLWMQELPESGDPEIDYLHGGSMSPAPEWSLTLSRFNGGSADEKTFRRHTMETAHLGDGNTIDFQMSGDDPETFLTQGTATSSPHWTSTPKSGYVRATSAQIRLLCHNAGAAPIIVRSIGERYSPHPELTTVKTYPFVFGENVSLKKGTDTRDPAIVMARLEQCQRDDPMTILDEFGRQIEGIVEPKITAIEREEAATNGYTVYGSLTISTSRRVARFDSAIYDIDSFA